MSATDSKSETAAFVPVATMTELSALNEDEILAGYMDWRSSDPEPGANRGRAYWHGWMNAARDRGEQPPTPEAARLAKEYSRPTRARKGLAP